MSGKIFLLIQKYLLFSAFILTNQINLPTLGGVKLKEDANKGVKGIYRGGPNLDFSKNLVLRDNYRPQRDNLTSFPHSSHLHFLLSFLSASFALLKSRHQSRQTCSLMTWSIPRTRSLKFETEKQLLYPVTPAVFSSVGSFFTQFFLNLTDVRTLRSGFFWTVRISLKKEGRSPKGCDLVHDPISVPS